MATANAHKRFTACGDTEAEELLQSVLAGISGELSGTGLCVYLGGSYGRGDGGVRLDRQNGVLYNDLDFFVFARNKVAGAEDMLKKIADKYEKILKVDVDFSRVMSIADIKNNARRLMLQELKRGYYPVCGEDLLAEYLPELPAAELPYSEACRLLLNRGMGLYLAGEKIAGKSNDTDFILRNIYKAILGAGDAMLIASGEYRWKIAERLDFTEKNDILASWQFLYREAVDFKHSPHRELPRDITAFWLEVRDFYRAALLRCAGADNARMLAGGIYRCSKKSGEISLKNLLKYCVKLRTLPLRDWKLYAIPPAAVILPELYKALDDMPQAIDRESRLYRHWQVFN